MAAAAVLVLGGVLGAALSVWARSRGPAAARRILSVGLFVAAALYVVFAALAGEAAWMGVEVVGLALFAVPALAGLRGAAWPLAAGWALHPAWDVLLHVGGPGAAAVPWWYPLLCLGFDPVVAVAVVSGWAFAHEAGEAGQAGEAGAPGG